MSFPAYPAYKKSDVEWLGEVPVHWILTPLKHLALLNPRKSDYDGDTEQLCSFVPMEKLKTGVVQLDEERPIGEVIGGYTYFEDGDVLQAKVTPCFENKNIAIAKGLTNGVGFGSSEINVLRPYQGVKAEYLYYRVQEDSYMDFCTSSMIGAGGLKRVPTDVINNFKVATPEVFEQTQIAHFLDHETARIDALIEEQQRLIELLMEKRQAVISHAVTKGLDPTVPMNDSGVKWLGEVPAHWEITQIKRRCDLITDGAHISPETESGIYCFVSTRDVSDEGIDFDGCLRTSAASYEYLVKTGCQPATGDVLFSKDGTIGRTIVVGENSPDFVVASSLIIIRPNRAGLLPTYLDFLCQSWVVSQQVDGFVKGAGLPRLSIQNLTKVVGVFPPLEEQALIADFLQLQCVAARQLSSEACRTVELLKERRSALISAAVTGKIDVRAWQPPASVPTPKIVQEAV